MRPKLQDVAALAGVSEATVSRVLNAKPGVSEKTRRLVLDVLSDLGYDDVPSRAAHSGIVGILTPEIDNPIFAVLAQAIEARLARHDYMCMVCPVTIETANEPDYLKLLLTMNAAGVVIVNGRYALAGTGYEAYETLAAQGRRVVLVNAVTLPCPVASVSVDVALGARLAVEHLASLGHTRIGCLTGPRRYVTTLEFAQGWREAMEPLGLATDDDLLSETLFTIEGGQAGTAKLMEAGVTGIVAASDLMAIGAVRAVRIWGSTVPDDVSIVGYDGTTLATVADPALTTVRQPVDLIASAAAALFVAPPAHDGTATSQVFAPELVVGASTATAPQPAAASVSPRG